jgi:beta-N-acetylhexosaminidase
MTTRHHQLDLGLRFIVEPSATELSKKEASELKDLRPAGIMLRKRNFEQSEPYESWFNTYKTLIDSCRQAIGRDSIIVSVDHEGGGVHRFPEPITRFPYAATYGANPDCVFEVASIMGDELAALGINVSFSPVADIHSNPNNPVINERAFGTSASAVSAAAIACARGLRQQGVVPCAKHFPGHGDTAADSHYALPLLSGTRAQLEERELAPFRGLIADGIELIMTAHIMVPELDNENQATISKPILTDLLRDKLGFKGLTIADALGMRGIQDAVNSDQFGIKAHTAGLDLFLFVGDTVSISDAIKLRNRIESAVLSNELDSSSLFETERRIKYFLSTLPQNKAKTIEADVLARHSVLAKKLKENAPWSEFKFEPAGFD